MRVASTTTNWIDSFQYPQYATMIWCVFFFLENMFVHSGTSSISAYSCYFVFVLSVCLFVFVNSIGYYLGICFPWSVFSCRSGKSKYENVPFEGGEVGWGGGGGDRVVINGFLCNARFILWLICSSIALLTSIALLLLFSITLIDVYFYAFIAYWMLL